MEKLNGNKNGRKSSLFNICPCEPKMVLENQRPFFILQSIPVYPIIPSHATHSVLQSTNHFNT